MKVPTDDIPELSLADAQRFAAKIKRGGPDECWEWTAATAVGYGRLKIVGKLYSAHRIAYFMATGHNPKGMLVTHDCDNRACCNPRHLRAGTHQTNAQEMADRGRAFQPRHHGYIRPKREQKSGDIRPTESDMLITDHVSH